MPFRPTPTPPLLGALLALTLVACGDVLDVVPPEEPGPTEPGPTEPAGPPVYQVAPPEGKLPWPHHDPDWDAARYEAMIDEIWVVNNFGLYQGGGDPNTVYLHDALDIGLPNGTPIFAVAAGTVRSNIGGNEFYRTLLIEDADRPGWGWGYTHIYHFTVEPGDPVLPGTPLGRVNFAGLEHIHLSRVRLRPGGTWYNYADLITVQPDTFFVYHDTEPPVFEGAFRYVRNQTDSAFVAPSPDGPVTVSGDVDIVVGLRDPGEWARSPEPWAGPIPYGDRNAPNRVEYDIAGDDGIILSAVAFDMSRLELPRGTSPAARAAQTLTLFQYYEAVEPAPPPVGNYNRKFNYYVITNSDGLDRDRVLDPADRAHAWDTAAVGDDGEPVFPDGEYVVTVRAYDFKGNMASRSEVVRVANGTEGGWTGARSR